MLVRPVEPVGMEEMREQLDAFRDSGTWPREVSVGIHRDYSRVA
jgi:hypothetical protein